MLKIYIVCPFPAHIHLTKIPTLQFLNFNISAVIYKLLSAFFLRECLRLCSLSLVKQFQIRITCLVLAK